MSKKQEPNWSNEWDKVMGKAAEKFGVSNLRNHREFRRRLEASRTVFPWDLSYREKYLVALAIYSTMMSERGEKDD